MSDFNRATVIHGTTIYGLQAIDQEECECQEKHAPSVLLGHVDFCGAFCHVFFIRVRDDEQIGQCPVCDPHNRWGEVTALDDVAFETVEVPGYEGEWVLWMYPGER